MPAWNRRDLRQEAPRPTTSIATPPSLDAGITVRPDGISPQGAARGDLGRG